jgi:hypothetical protein
MASHRATEPRTGQYRNHQRHAWRLRGATTVFREYEVAPHCEHPRGVDRARPQQAVSVATASARYRMYAACARHAAMKIPAFFHDLAMAIGAFIHDYVQGRCDRTTVLQVILIAGLASLGCAVAQANDHLLLSDILLPVSGVFYALAISPVFFRRNRQG